MIEPVPTTAPMSGSLKRIAVLGAMMPSGPAMAQGYMGQDTSLIAKYRCAVLGDTSQCTFPPKKPATCEEDRVVVGPYAHCLIHLGSDPAKAVLQARAIGEIPTLQRVRITTRTLTSAETHDRVNGRFVEPEVQVEVLASRPLQDDEALAMF